ncbi:MAG TPA: sigma-54 dependent transcriptional regulator [Rickettsiales bacterium]|nr:sigma-54 dependent transcriptional regulator [Rickettsiales bacterium]
MRLLIIGELEGQIGAASRIARSRGAKVSQTPAVDSALTLLRNGQGADMIMIDAKADIKKLIGMLESERIIIPVVACGVHSDSDIAVSAIRSGAKEYIPLPPDEDLIAAVLEAITAESHTVIHASPQMRRVLELADQVAGSDASVLITGESGTGKEVIAQYIHRKSKRSGNNFISVNCAAIPEALLESELFGHEKGAFTGAVARRIGKFEEANNGSLLLDEISEMDVRLQAKLLRVIQEREIDRIGGTKPVKINLRILATSNRDLQQEAKKGTFREDLYFRLNVISIHIPPLRERKEDILPIAEFFVDKYSKANGVPVRKFSTGALEKMMHYSWPGNVRELENITHRAVLLASGNEISADAVTLPNVPTSAGMVAVQAPEDKLAGTTPLNKSELVGRTVESVERELIIDTLNYCLGNRTHAANILGISIRTLRNKLKMYGEEEKTGT